MNPLRRSLLQGRKDKVMDKWEKIWIRCKLWFQKEEATSCIIECNYILMS